MLLQTNATNEGARNMIKGGVYFTATPSFSKTLRPFSWYSSLVIQKESLSFMMSVRTAPPKNTMCLRLGGSSIRILNFYKRKER